MAAPRDHRYCGSGGRGRLPALVAGHHGGCPGIFDDLDSGRYRLEPVDTRLFRRAVELDRQYADLGLGLADGTVTAAAERYQADVILTLDDRFRVAAPDFALAP